MFSTVHAASTVVLVGILWYPLQPPVDILYIAVASAVLLDMDIIFARDNEHGHRDLLSHSMIPWFIPLIISLWIPVLFWVAVPIMLHLVLDAIDGGIMPFNPFSKWRPPHITIEGGGESARAYIANYWTSGVFDVLEVIIAVGAVIISWSWDSGILFQIVKSAAMFNLGLIIVLSVYFRIRPR